MQTNLLWSGREYYSLENCLVDISSSGAVINSTIIGLYEGKIYKVEYKIETNQHWQTTLLEINSRHSNQTQSICLKGDGKGQWTRDDKIIEEFAGCIDVDIPLTPFTNTLPIRRLDLKKNESQEIRVIYCDLLQQELRAVRQKYTCREKLLYHYQNIPNDFEAVIEIDESGFVVDYPSLFVRTAVQTTNYT